MVPDFFRPLLIVASILTAGAANAATQTVSFNGSTGVSEKDSTLTLQQFDSSLGSLSSISIDWTTAFLGKYIADQLTAEDSGNVTAPDGFITSVITTTAAPTPGAMPPSLNSSGGTAFNVSVPSAYQQLVADGATLTQTLVNFPEFVGLGTISYGFSGTALDSSIASNGLLRGFSEYLYLVNATITYSYEVAAPTTTSPVPLPAALPLALAGLGLLGSLKLRRKS